MSLCTICGRYLCDHTAEERGQTQAEMDAPLTVEEKKAWESGNDEAKLAAARSSQEERRSHLMEKTKSTMQGVVIVIKVYNSSRDWKSGGKPLTTKTVCTVEEFDAVIQEYASSDKYLTFEGASGAKLKTRAAARFILLTA